jgi:2-dehydropantoate 2-reductase
MEAVPLVEDLEGKFEVIFLAMKATDVIDSVKNIVPILKEDSVVVTLQNGIVEDDVGKLDGRDRFIGASVARVSTVINPGIIKRNLDRAYYIGLLETSGNQKRLEEVAKLLEYDMPVVKTENIYGALYSKLGINASLNGLGAISGLTVGG